MPKVAGFALAVFFFLTGCSSSSSSQPAAAASQAPAKGAGGNPVGKYIELVGFRIEEKSPGKLTIHFGVVNHSEADVGDLALNVSVRTTAGKPDDAPLFEFPLKVSGLGPQTLKDVTAEASTKLRVYELPDWQFLKASFVVTSPPP